MQTHTLVPDVWYGANRLFQALLGSALRIECEFSSVVAAECPCMVAFVVGVSLIHGMLTPTITGASSALS